MEALEPFAVDNYPQDTEILPYLKHDDKYAFDINLSVAIQDETMVEPTVVCKSNFKVYLAFDVFSIATAWHDWFVLVGSNTY